MEITLIQTLLNAEACIGNMLPCVTNDVDRVVGLRARNQVIVYIEKLRGDTPPGCYGEDDCSTQVLSMCPWRMTCGS